MQFILFAAMLFSFSAAGSFLKHLTRNWDLKILLLTVTFIAFGYVLNFLILKRVGLGEMTVLYSSAQIVMLTFLGHFFFKEPLNAWHVLGVIAAIAAAWLMSMGSMTSTD